MSTIDSTEPQEFPSGLSEHDAQLVLDLLRATGEVHDDLWSILTQPDADSVIDEVFRDELQAQRS